MTLIASSPRDVTTSIFSRSTWLFRPREPITRRVPAPPSRYLDALI
ncbi:hypothetical protein PUN28_015035 [Cardiocondyla obscurior]|uniref:Uncharacterized protein n=1 Tax=Cardiocondyla obscurior TaxID=286306 RepID=A0AAW2EWJ9_9HYME